MTRIRTRPWRTAVAGLLVVLLVSTATAAAARAPVAGSPTHAVVGSASRPSPTDRADGSTSTATASTTWPSASPVRELGGRPWPVRSTSSMAAPAGWQGPTRGSPRAVPRRSTCSASRSPRATSTPTASPTWRWVTQRRREGCRPGWRGQRLLRLGRRPASNQPGPPPGQPGNSDRFGSALDAGLFNDDDFLDLAVGAPGETVGGRPDAGAVSVFYGSAAGLPATSQGLFQGNPEQGDRSERRWSRGSQRRPGRPGGRRPRRGHRRRRRRRGGQRVLRHTGRAAGHQPGPPPGQPRGRRPVRSGAGSRVLQRQHLSDLAVGAPTGSVGTNADAGAVSVFLGSAIQLVGSRR